VIVHPERVGEWLTGLPDWYASLAEDCRAILTEAVFTSRWALVEGYWLLGQRIVTDEHYQEFAKGNKSSVQDLARNIGQSERTIYYAVQFYTKYTQLDTVPEGKNITWNKIVTKYLPLPRVEPVVPASASAAHLYIGDMCDIVPDLGKFDLVVTDPPYGVTAHEWDVLDTKKWLGIIVPQLKERYNIFWFCAPEYAADIEMIFREMRLPIQSRIVWHRRNMALGSHARGKFIDTWEMILHAGNRELNFPAEWSDAWFDVQTFAVPQSNFTDRKYHPTQKPEDLIRRLVEFGSYPGDRILDPFAGSGTTGSVCPGDRECVLVEQEQEYASIIKNRLGI
jgi:site-specific DNA-methyltransferase (adenine-specific)